MIDLNLERGGPWEEIDKLKAVILEKVIPRLLRPMETYGRSIKPALVHGDLWCGNAAVNLQTDSPLIYDPASFYAHNECKCSMLSASYNFLMKLVRWAWKLAPRTKQILSGLLPCISFARSKICTRGRLRWSKRSLFHVRGIFVTFKIYSQR
jgi:hypothetical protein